MHQIKMNQSSHQQRGAVLIVALIMLLLLTLVGVAGIRDTQLQEKMAGGTEDRAIAFQAAESALRAGEAEVVTGTYTGSCSTGTCFKNYTGGTAPNRTCTNTTNAACSETAYWAQYTWTGTNATAYAGTGLTQVKTQPRYVVEQLPQNYSPITGTTNGGTLAGTGVHAITDFLITARATGRTDNAVVILQSMYRYVTP